MKPPSVPDSASWFSLPDMLRCARTGRAASHLRTWRTPRSTSRVTARDVRWRGRSARCVTLSLPLSRSLSLSLSLSGSPPLRSLSPAVSVLGWRGLAETKIPPWGSSLAGRAMFCQSNLVSAASAFSLDLPYCPEARPSRFRGAGCSLRLEKSSPPWRQPRGKTMVSLVNSHANATRIRQHLWEIDLRFALNSTPGWHAIAFWDGVHPLRRTSFPPYQIPTSRTLAVTQTPLGLMVL